MLSSAAIRKSLQKIFPRKVFWSLKFFFIFEICCLQD
jgi:hypothetical protein